MSTIDLTQPLDPTDPGNDAFLANLQGNILKSHGRNFTINLFLTFPDGAHATVSEWITQFTDRFVTSALRQKNETREFKLSGISGGTFVTLSLSAKGYEYLGLDTSRFTETRNQPFSPNVFFKAGMQDPAGVTELSDPDPSKWTLNPKGTTTHALILIADESAVRVRAAADQIRDRLPQGTVPVVVEGVGLRDENNQPLEHFGYRDGISQPLFLTTDIADDKKQNRGNDQWDPAAPLSLLLVADPLAPACKPGFGSYFVFRKLREHVAAFKKAEEALGATLGVGERAGALVVGRFENGVPVTLSSEEDIPLLRDYNNFNYQSDSDGARCPFQAHIRKTNPRFDTATVRIGLTEAGGIIAANAEERDRRITRRGITFGNRVLYKKVNGKLQETTDTDPLGFLPSDEAIEKAGLTVRHPGAQDEPVGLLFQCYQASIPDHFAFMQKNWVNAPDFARPAPATGIDPVIGQPSTDNSLPQTWPAVYGDPSSVQSEFFGGHVEMLGGEYFFTPSIPFLLELGTQIKAVSDDLHEFEAKQHTVYAL